MKKYAIILLVLIVIGVALSVQLFTQEEKLDQTVFLQTTESIRNLQTLDKNLRLLLNQSRFNIKFDHEQLSELNYQISEEFDNLRFDALFEEIEGSPELSLAVSDFEEKFVVREEKLEAYIDGNISLSQSLVTTQELTDTLDQNEIIRSQAAFLKSLAANKTALFDLTLGSDLKSTLLVVQPELEIPEELALVIGNYHKAITNIKERHLDTLNLYNDLNQLDTGELLDAIEDRYTAYHNQAIGGSNALRNGLIAYGLALLVALFFFGYQIRKSFLSLEQQVADRTAEIKTAYDDLQESQEQLIQSEKMASLGQMVAGVAHEINTPLGYVNSNIGTLKLNLTDLSEIMSDVKALLGTIETPQRDNKVITQKLMTTLRNYKRLEAQELVDESTQLLEDGSYGLSEISKLVTSLKDFARLDRQTTEQINVHDCIESSLTIASNHIRDNNVSVVRDFNELPKIACFPSKLNQLFLNIITNACQAMKQNGGELLVRSYVSNEEIHLEFADQGIGMDEETQQKMFDPFFTSKEIGEGTGLGLSIAYKIIEAHGGRIEVSSQLTKGTKLTIILPIT